MWKRYKVTLQMTGRFAASMAKTEKEIQSMLENRMPVRKPEDAVPIEELAEQVAVEVGTEPEIGWATFKRDENGLYYEGRCIRGHIKDVAQQISSFFSDIRAFKSKVANKVYVEDDKIYLGKSEPDGYEQRFIQIMTRRGPRSTYKFIDYVEKPKLVFVLKVLDDGVINRAILEAIFEYGGTHGMGQERGQSWGRYEVKELKEV
jgi:hypothetical protein